MPGVLLNLKKIHWSVTAIKLVIYSMKCQTADNVKKKHVKRTIAGKRKKNERAYSNKVKIKKPIVMNAISHCVH